MLPRTVGLLLPLACLTPYTGCHGPQSTFLQAGEGARQITQLFYWMAGGGVGIWLIVMAIIILAIRSKEKYDPRITSQIIIGGGVFVPTAVLTGLLCYGLSILPALQAPAPEGSLTIEVAGVRWWWRVYYRSLYRVFAIDCPHRNDDTNICENSDGRIWMDCVSLRWNGFS